MIPKFRAWDSEANIMIYSDHRTRKLYDVYYGFEMNEKGELECRWEGDFTESHVLDGGILDNIMQSTGLKDKNGFEIFEGDIVNHYWSNEVGESFCHKTVIKNPFDYKVNEAMYLIYADELEILGNIWENPELLEGE